jgi:hypothetical protein
MYGPPDQVGTVVSNQADVRAMARSGELRDAHSLAALALFDLRH